MATTVNTPLLICVGNPSRGDDAIGPLIAQTLQQTAPSLNVIETFQLQPELVVDMVDQPVVIIIDAQANASQAVTLRKIVPSPSLGWCSHALAPEQLLGLYFTAHPSQALSQTAPTVIALGIQAHCFELGAPVSDVTLDLVLPVCNALMDAAIAIQQERVTPTFDVFQFLQKRLIDHA